MERFDRKMAFPLLEKLRCLMSIFVAIEGGGSLERESGSKRNKEKNNGKKKKEIRIY